MIPEISVTCGSRRLSGNTVTVGQYREYVSLMGKNRSGRIADVMFFNKRILQGMFGHRVSLEELGKTDAAEFLAAVKATHFAMQEIVLRKLLDVAGTEEGEEAEESAFDEYDIENGYEEEQPEQDQWEVCGEIINRVIRLSIRLLRDSYSQCMGADIIALAEYLKFELGLSGESRE